jgi:hypothetical protein
MLLDAPQASHLSFKDSEDLLTSHDFVRRYGKRLGKAAYVLSNKTRTQDRFHLTLWCEPTYLEPSRSCWSPQKAVAAKLAVWIIKRPRLRGRAKIRNLPLFSNSKATLISLLISLVCLFPYLTMHPCSLLT